MLKTLLRLRMAALLAAFSGHNRKRRSQTKGKAVGYAFLMLYCFCAFVFLFYISFSQLAAAFFPVGLGWLYFAMFAIMAFALMFIGSVFTAKSQLFEAKDNELLLSMPVKPGMILLSRMAALLVMNFVFELVVALPVLVAWLRYGSVSGAGVLSFIVIVLALPLFSLAVSCLFAWLISLITSRMRNTTVVTMVLSVVFLLAYFAFCFRMNAYVTTLAANGQMIAGALSAAVSALRRRGADRGSVGNLGTGRSFFCACRGSAALRAGFGRGRRLGRSRQRRALGTLFSGFGRPNGRVSELLRGSSIFRGVFDLRLCGRPSRKFGLFLRFVLQHPSGFFAHGRIGKLQSRQGFFGITADLGNVGTKLNHALQTGKGIVGHGSQTKKRRHLERAGRRQQSGALVKCGPYEASQC